MGYKFNIIYKEKKRELFIFTGKIGKKKKFVVLNLKTPIPDHLATYFHSIIGKPSQVKARKEKQTYAKLEMDK